MATVVKNLDESYTVTLTPREHKTLKRAGETVVPGRSKAQQLAFVLSQYFVSTGNDFRAQDLPKRLAKYDAAPDAIQDQIDQLLGGI